MKTHDSMPFAERIGEDLYKIYFCGRNHENRAQIGYVIININFPKKIIKISKNPLIKLGKLGTFDDTGVWVSSIVNHQRKKYLYYIGRTNGGTVPFYSFIGLAVSKDNGKTFQKYSQAPILERNNIDPYMTHTPFVIIENGLFRMWYGSGVKWEKTKDLAKHYYHIKYAESRDGIIWNRRGAVCIDFKSRDEYAIARPSIIKENGIYKMWYTYRGKSYRIGYAESRDGIKWIRKDRNVGIDISKSGWDSEMICYPHVFEHKGIKYMLYNGNGYGKTGCGYAILNSKKK